MVWRCNNNFGDTIMKVWTDENKRLHVNFDKFDASCLNGDWVKYFAINLPSGNTFRSMNAKFEIVTTPVFIHPESNIVKNWYVTDIKRTNP